MPIFPEIKRLVEDIEKKSQSQIVVDVTTIALTLVNTISKCTEKQVVSKFFWF